LHLNHSKAAGPDESKHGLYKELTNEISTILTLIYSNISLNTGDVSKDWKITHVIIHEKFEYTKGVISGGKLKDRQYNGQ